MTISTEHASMASPLSQPTMNDNSNDMVAKAPRKKLHGRAFYERIGSPKFILAPMVDQSEFAWRMLTRSFMPKSSPKDLLAYTPMLHARLFNGTPKFRHNHFQPLRTPIASPESPPAPVSKEDLYLDGNPSFDRPLFVQFCANDPDELLAAAKHVSLFCDAVDLNLGCPQGIARKGKYGAFLQEDQTLIFNLINKLHKELDIPVTAKIRILDTKEETLEYARNVVRAGASIVTVHGRKREMKGHKTGLADWSMIRYLREQLPREVVMFANGNILRREDIDRCLEETGVDGVMSAEGNLCDPGIFADPPDVGEEGVLYWRDKEGKGGWRMDTVFRRYMDILYRYVLEVPIPQRKPLYGSDEKEPETAILETTSSTSNPREAENSNNKRQHASVSTLNSSEPTTQPPSKKQKQEPVQTKNQKGEKRERTQNPNLIAMQPHLFHLLRPLVAKHHHVRDALARCRAGDIEAFERVLEMVESVVGEGIREFERTGRWEENTKEKENDGKGEKGKERKRKGEENEKEKVVVELDESSVETVKECRRPWWVIQPYVRPLPKEALAKGSLTLGKKERAKLERERAEMEKLKSGGKVGVKVLGDGVWESRDKEKVEVPKEGLVCG